MTAYPSGYDTFPAHGALMSDTPTHDDSHILLEEAVAALQAALGLNPSASAATVAARIGRIDQVVADRTAVLAISSPVAGMRAFETALAREWIYTGTEWRITGMAQVPRAGFSEASITHGSGSNSAWLAHAISGWGTINNSDAFRSGSNIVIPTGFGGDFDVTVEANVGAFGSGNNKYGVRAVITSNTGATNEVGEVGELRIHTAPYGSVRSFAAGRVRLEAGATLQFQTYWSHSGTPANCFFTNAKITLAMVNHLPGLT
jgi:hypothetical protein